MEKKYKKYIPLFVVAGVAFAGVGIYIIVNHIGMPVRAGYNAEPANFWLGLWHGLILCLSFIASWFDKNIVLYQVNNVGFWYNFGFIIGLTIAIGGSAGGSSKKGKKKKSKINLECE